MDLLFKTIGLLKEKGAGIIYHTQTVEQKNMEMTAFFCENGWISQAAVKAGLEQASRMEWAEGTAE